MAHSNRPLTSRECKIMLDTNRFMDRKKGTHEISTIIERLVKGQGGNFKADVEEKERRTWYLDTNAYELYHNNNFLLRIRKKKNSDEYDLTLKCRHPDRYVSASYDLTSSVKDIEIKFEEDIVTDKTNPFISKFSLSASLKRDQEPDLYTIKDLVFVFPGLDLGIDANKTLTRVNNFEAIEIASEIGKITFAGDKTVKAELNLWYSSAEQEKPMIVEFTFNYKAKNHDEQKEMLLEEYSHTLVTRAGAFYKSLRMEDVVDLNTTKTKTDFVYQNKCIS